MSHLPIWYLGQVSPEELSKAEEEFAAVESKKATMGTEGETLDLSTRDTTVSFIDINHWFGLKMNDFAIQANKICKWGFHLENHEAVQYAEYGPAQHYNWHVDTFFLSGKDVDRKVTVVCLMNDPSAFEGGQFQIRFNQEYTAPLQKGTIIAFPSFLEHRVIPITSGVRYSATMWVNGPRFR